MHEGHARARLALTGVPCADQMQRERPLTCTSFRLRIVAGVQPH
jgi:hypothetical protein